jgi:uncharacterized protein
MRKTLVLALLVISTAWAVRAQGVTGEWRGALKVGATELHLVLHVSSDKSGALQASLDSVDQGAFGIPVTSITFKGPELDFVADSIHGSYKGVLSPDGKSLDGTWTQGQSFPLNFTRAVGQPKPVKPSDIDGAWVGALQAGANKLRVVFHIFNTEDALRATLDSPDQGAKGIPVTSVVRTGSHITMEVQSIGGKFEGAINEARTEIQGTWTQSGSSLQLVLERVRNVSELEPNRPQNPKGPLPYEQEPVSFENKTAGIRLAGTMTIPPDHRLFPAVVLIAGSGPHDRDETVFGHKPFLVLADYLTRRDIVVLRYDKRGVGQSGGSEATATIADFAGDAEAAFEFLRSQPKVNPREVGLIGHSEGGEIAPIVAARNRNVAFIVMLAGPGVPGDQLLVAQTLAVAEASGMDPARAKKQADEEGDLVGLVKNSPAGPALDAQLRAKLSGQVPPAMLGDAIKELDSPWMRYFVRYDPATTLEQVQCPVLALIGEKDAQVPSQQNLPAIRKALTAGGNKDFEVDELPGLNHLFQPAQTGAPSEYYGIDTTMSLVALRTISDWVLKQTADQATRR